MSRLSTVSAAAVALGVAGAAAFGLAVPAASGADAEGSPVVSNRETVNVKMDATGEVQVARVYDQIAVSGQGTVEITNPVGEQDLRNLDGLGTPSVSDGAITTTLEVDGEAQQRTVSTFDGQIPVDVQVRYVLDGAEVSPGQLVGATGELEVSYRVENVTGTPTEITFKDGRGEDVTKTVDVVTPLIGSLTTTLPERFTQITSGQANVTGDGRGNTRLTFTMTLIPPIAGTVAEFGYTTYVRNGLVPFANISLVPVKPFENPTLSNAANSYQGGADTGQQLTDGASQIDENVLKLADGAGKLLAGVLQLQDGSLQLQEGLAGEAAPGAAELATGVGQIDDGAQRLSDGAARLADGAGQLDDGLQQAESGSVALAGGAGQIDQGLKGLQDGLTTLYKAADSLPASVEQQLATNADYQRLLGTLQAIVNGIGTPADATPATLQGGLNNIKWGLRHPAGYAATDCAVALTGGTPAACGAMDAVQFVSEQLSTGATDLNQLKPALQALYNGGVLGAPCPGAPGAIAPPASPPETPCDLVATVYYGLFDTPTSAQSKVQAASGALAGVYAGVDGQIIPGINQIRRLLYNDPCNPAQTNPAAADYCGISQALTLVKAGIPQLVSTLTTGIESSLTSALGVPKPGCDPTATLRCAAAALGAGAGELADGADQLNDGLGQLADGADQLADGSEELSDGAGQLAAGTSRASDGAARLADGLGAAADGSGQLADGLGQAADGVTQIEDGANRLSDEGTSQLVAAGNATALDFGEKYALIAAAAETTEDGGLPYGAPEGAIATAAYSIDILAESGQSGKNVTRGIIALVLALGAAAGAFVLAQRA